MVLLLAGCAGSEPQPEPPPPEAPPSSEPPSSEPPSSEPPPPEPPPPEPPPPEPPAPEPAEPPVTEPAETVPPRLPPVVMAPPAPAEETQPPPTASDAPPAATSERARVDPGPSPLELAVPDLDELRHDLTFVDEVPSLTAPLAGAPASLAPPEGPEAATALFVRVREAWLGGELDAAGDEEVRIDVAQGEAEVVLDSRTLDLASELRGIPFNDAAWVELAPPAPLRDHVELGLTVWEEDETDDELMTQTPVFVPIPAASFGSEPTPVEIPLDPIVGVEVRIFGANRKIRLEGAKLTLERLRAPRRAEPDAAALALVRRVFAPLLALPERPRAGDAAALLALARAAAQAGDEAMRAAARSTDTWVRRELPPLAAEARRLAVVAAAAAQADGTVVRGAQVAVGRAIAGLPPGEARRAEAQEALGQARSLAEPLLEQLLEEELRRGAELAEQVHDALYEVSAADEEGASELTGVAESLASLQRILERAARGLALDPVAREGLAALRARIPGR